MVIVLPCWQLCTNKEKNGLRHPRLSHSHKMPQLWHWCRHISTVDVIGEAMKAMDGWTEEPNV